MRNVIYVLAGVLFSVGLVISGMTQTAKVLGFLDFFGDWDPSLVFVMGGAVSVHLLAFRFLKRPTPYFSDRYWIPTRREIDSSLILGAALFGIGWGLVGYCPGPAITSLVALEPKNWAFVVSMLLGMWAFGRSGLRPS